MATRHHLRPYVPGHLYEKRGAALAAAHARIKRDARTIDRLTRQLESARATIRQQSELISYTQKTKSAA